MNFGFPVVSIFSILNTECVNCMECEAGCVLMY